MDKQKEGRQEKIKLSPKRRNVANRFSRMAGQCLAVKKMAEEGRPCAEVLQQVMAIKSAINAAAVEVVRDTCDTKDMNEDVVKALMKFI